MACPIDKTTRGAGKSTIDDCVFKSCDEPSQCQSLVCKDNRCQAATCADGVKNGDETDVDCGGTCATKCAATSGCSFGNDCASGVCSGGVSGCQQTCPGLNVKYYVVTDSAQLPDFSTLTSYASASVDSLNLQPTLGAFPSSGSVDFFGAQFTAWVNVPSAGVWTFFLNSDDGSKLYVDDTLVVDNDFLHPMREKSGSVTLTQGLHAIRVDFYEWDQVAGLIVSWESAGVAKQVVPRDAWTRAC